MRIILGILGLAYKLYVGIVFVLTLLFFYPFLLICLSKEDWKKYSFPINIAWSYTMRLLALIWVRTYRSKKLPKGPYLIVANHTSYFDIFLLYSILPHHRFLFMGKGEILNYPLLKTFFKRLNIPVFRGDRIKSAKAFIQAKRALSNGWSVVIFPEGGIPDEDLPQMIPFKEGAFKLAKSAEVGILPMTFLDNYHVFSDPEQILGFAHPGISRVYVHDIISKEEVAILNESELSIKTFDIVAEPLRARGLMR